MGKRREIDVGTTNILSHVCHILALEISNVAIGGLPVVADSEKSAPFFGALVRDSSEFMPPVRIYVISVLGAPMKPLTKHQNNTNISLDKSLS
jgi:hypothetical protein